MKHINKLWVRITAAVLVGFLLAGAGTKITYSCAPIDGAKGCLSYEKAIMHPGDLIDNKQDSLIKFSTAFAITSLSFFALLSASLVKKKT